MSADRNMVLRVARTCCGSQPGGCGSATYLCSDVCGMLRVVTVIPAPTGTRLRLQDHVVGPQPVGCGSQPMSAETVCRFFCALFKGDPTRTVSHLFCSSKTLTLSLLPLSHVLRTSKRVEDSIPLTF